MYPPIDSEVGFCFGSSASFVYITHLLHITEQIICLKGYITNYRIFICMEIQIINRIPTGVAFGWSYYLPDEEHDFIDLTIHLGIIDLRFLW